MECEMTDKSGGFDLKGFLGSFDQPEMYHGDQNSYVTIAKKGVGRVAIHVEGAMATVKFKGKVSPVMGLGIRLIVVRENLSDFAQIFGARGSAHFKDDTKTIVKGARLLKTFLPISSWPISGKDLYPYIDTEVMPKLVGWLKAKIAEAGGEMILSDASLIDALKHAIPPIPEGPDFLFHLPGEHPDWKGPVLEEPPLPKHSPQLKKASSPFADADDEPDEQGDYQVITFPSQQAMSNDNGTVEETCVVLSEAKQLAEDYLAEDDEVYSVVVRDAAGNNVFTKARDD
jgi:hypothetical protein